MHSLIICRTCPRGTDESGSACAALAARMKDVLRDHAVVIRRVNCLGACTQPCAIALDAPGKFRLRFSDLRLADAGELECVIRQYCSSENGSLPTESLPPGLRSRLSALSPKYPPTVAPTGG